MPPQTVIRGTPFDRYSTRGTGRASRARTTGMPGRPVAPRPGHPSRPSLGSGRFTLESAGGVDHQLHGREWNLGRWDGHDLSVVWLVAPGESSGPYVAVLDHASGAIQYNDRVLARLSRPRLTPIVGLAAVAALVEAGVGVAMLAIGLGAWWLAGLRGRDRLKRDGTLRPADDTPKKAG